MLPGSVRRWFDHPRRIAAVLGLLFLPHVLLAQLTERIGPRPSPPESPGPTPRPADNPPTGTPPGPAANPVAPVPPKDLYGNYYVEWHDFPRRGAAPVRARMELRRERTPVQPDPALNGLYALIPDEKSPLIAVGETTADRVGRLANKVRMEYSRSAVVPAARTELQQVGPDELRGQWHQRERQGLEIWRRSQPSITHVHFQSAISDTVVRGVPGRVQIPYREEWDKAGMSLGNRPDFRITVYGSDLWGWPDLRMLEGRGLLPAATGGVYFIGADRESNASWIYTSNASAGVVGFTFRVILEAGSTPGRKIIRINGIPISFDLLIPGYPKGPATFPARPGPSLRFVKLTGATFTPVEGGVTPGDTVSVEARYEDPPAGATAEITLEWAEGSRKVTVHRTPENRNLYRSFPLTISTTQGAGRPDR